MTANNLNDDWWKQAVVYQIGEVGDLYQEDSD